MKVVTSGSTPARARVLPQASRLAKNATRPAHQGDADDPPAAARGPFPERHARGRCHRGRRSRPACSCLTNLGRGRNSCHARAAAVSAAAQGNHAAGTVARPRPGSALGRGPSAERSSPQTRSSSPSWRPSASPAPRRRSAQPVRLIEPRCGRGQPPPEPATGSGATAAVRSTPARLDRAGRDRIGQAGAGSRARRRDRAGRARSNGRRWRARRSPGSP